MKTRILLLFMIVALFVFAGYRLYDRPETWLKTEQNGLCHELDYLHCLAERKPGKVREYLGALVSFEAELGAVFDMAEILPYGKFEKIFCFDAGEGKHILVDGSSAAIDEAYDIGRVMRVRGRVTRITGDCVMLLNVYGGPGFPNRISIENINVSIMP